MTDIYMRNDNLKRTGQLRSVRVESGFVTVCPLTLTTSPMEKAAQKIFPVLVNHVKEGKCKHM